MNDKEKQKLKDKIISGQSLAMLVWEFKSNKKQIIKFAKDNNLLLRNTDSIYYSSRIQEKERKNRRKILR